MDIYKKAFWKTLFPKASVVAYLLGASALILSIAFPISWIILLGIFSTILGIGITGSCLIYSDKILPKLVEKIKNDEFNKYFDLLPPSTFKNRLIKAYKNLLDHKKDIPFDIYENLFKLVNDIVKNSNKLIKLKTLLESVPKKDVLKKEIETLKTNLDKNLDFFENMSSKVCAEVLIGDTADTDFLRRQLEESINDYKEAKEDIKVLNNEIN